MKKIIGMLGVLSFVAIAGTWSDLKFLSDRFMDENVEIEQVEAPVKRHIASDIEINSERIYFPVNEENSLRINGSWTVNKYTFNYSEGEKLNIKITLELVGNGLVKIVDENIGNNEDQIFEITKLTDQNEMKLVVNLSGGREVLDLSLSRPEVAAKKVEEQVAESAKEVAEKMVDDIDLVVVSAHNPTKDKAAKIGSMISGNMVIVDGVVEELNVSIEEVSVNLSGAEIKTAGIFNTEYDGQPISGRYTVLGEESVRVRFFSGPLAGTIVEFGSEYVRESKIEENQEHEVIRERQFAGEMVYDRMTDKAELVAETEEEMDAKAEESGFDFN